MTQPASRRMIGASANLGAEAGAKPGAKPGVVIDVAIRCPRWAEVVPGARGLARRAARAALAAGIEAGAGAEPGAGAAVAGGGVEVSILLADDALLRRLNHRYRGRDRVTNVLSFPAWDGVPPAVGADTRALGDVVIACETVTREAAAQAMSSADHLCHLVIHGVLHLLGFDHEEAPAADRMEALEVAVLAGLGISDPYAPKAEDRQAAALGAGAGATHRHDQRWEP